MYCQQCGKPVSSVAVRCPECNKYLARNSSAWYLLPVFMNVVGGVIVYAAMRDRNPRMAKRSLALGIGLVALALAVGGVAASCSTPVDMEPADNMDENPFTSDRNTADGADLTFVRADVRPYADMPAVPRA